jgi:tRNA (guanine37-N1)-methyltransferase
MRIDVLTLFPEVFEPFVQTSIVGRACRSGILTIRRVNFRDYSADAHHSVDDRPFGGGPGMVLMCGPVLAAVEALRAEDPPPSEIVLLSPQGERLTQSLVAEFSACPRWIVVCGRYEGFDERIREGLGAREVSIGDYVLSGGEPAAMVLIDAVARLLPGALGAEDGAENDSFATGVLEYPQYTKPRVFRGLAVPDVLVSGDHGRIASWRRYQALARTRARRPELLNAEHLKELAELERTWGPAAAE